jgi:hypothetical protein
MLKLYTAEHPIEAQLLKGFLEANGVETLVQGEPLFSGRGELSAGFDTLPTVWIVHAGQHARARALLEDWQRVDSLPDWRCRQCGEPIDGTFDSCWQCGAMRL